jgi:hypothetical protein
MDRWPTIPSTPLAAAGGPERWGMDGRLYGARDEFGCTVMNWRTTVYTPAAP